MNEGMTNSREKPEDVAMEPKLTGVHLELANWAVRVLRGEYDEPVEIRTKRRKAS